MNVNEAAVAAVLAKDRDALNASDTDAVTPLYTEDGVFMPPYSPSAVGAAALRQAYDAVFRAISGGLVHRSGTITGGRCLPASVI